MYNCLYDWSSSNFSGFSSFLKNIYETSVNYYKKIMRKDSLGEQKYRLNKIKEFVNNIEIYFYELIKLGYVTKSNIYFVLRQLISIELIKFVKKDEENSFAGYTEEKIISLNPKIPGKGKLDSKNRTLLYSAHEYGHVINQKWKLEVFNYAKNVWQNAKIQREGKRFGFSSPKYFMMGFDMLDEAITQDMAENITYDYVQKERPAKEFKMKEAVLGRMPYLTNFDYYGEFQEIAVKFAKGLGTINSSSSGSFEDVLKQLGKMATKENFSSILLNEFNGDLGKLRDYFIMISAMGTMKDASYRVLNLSDNEDATNMAEKNYNVFNNLSNYYIEKKKNYRK